MSANVNALLAPVSVGAPPSVSLPAEGGGPFTESLLPAGLLGTPVEVAKRSTRGNSAIGSVGSSATTVNTSIAGLVTASAARSRCSATRSSADASAAVVDLVVAAIPISIVEPGPSTSVALPIGRVIVNEQRRTGDSQIVVNAAHIILDAAVATGDVVIAQSRWAVKTSSRAQSKKRRRPAAR